MLIRHNADRTDRNEKYLRQSNTAPWFQEQSAKTLWPCQAKAIHTCVHHFPVLLRQFYTIYMSTHQSNMFILQMNIEGSRLEWCISSMIYSRDTPFWSETLDILPTHTHTLIYTHVCACTHAHTNTHTLVNIYTHMHIYTHRHACTQPLKHKHAPTHTYPIQKKWMITGKEHVLKHKIHSLETSFFIVRFSSSF